MIDPRKVKGEFADLCRTAAGAMESDNPALLSILEKDYWITRVLCALAETHRENVVFKGGTSLSKGFGLTERFSEDVDLAVDPGSRGHDARHSLLKRIARSVADQCALDAITINSERGVHRTVGYAFEAIWAGGDVVRPTVLLEMGTRSALEPQSVQHLQTLLASYVPSVADELPSCELNVLGAERTLIEKFFVVHSAAVRFQEGDLGSLVRVGRHFYDLDRLVANTDVNRSIGSAAFHEMVADCDRRSAQDFPQNHRAPANLDFARSPGLFPVGKTREALAGAYGRDLPLFFGEFSTFDQILMRLDGIRERLVPPAMSLHHS